MSDCSDDVSCDDKCVICRWLAGINSGSVDGLDGLETTKHSTIMMAKPTSGFSKTQSS